MKLINAFSQEPSSDSLNEFVELLEQYHNFLNSNNQRMSYNSEQM